MPWPFDRTYMQLALAAGLVVGVCAPLIGTFLVQKRMSLIGDGIGHVAFAGVAAGLLLEVAPIWAALVACVLGALAVEWLRSRGRAAGDLALALFFYAGLAAGVVLLGVGTGLGPDVFTFLFGSILTVTRGDLILVLVLGIAGLAVIAVLYRGLVAVAIDEESARVSGVPVTALNVTLAALAGVTIAVSMRIVGILLIAALMVLPVMTASRLAASLRATLIAAMEIGLVSVLLGLVAAYYLDLAPGGAIVLIAAGMFVLVTLAGPLLGRRGGVAPLTPGR
jgi:zinc transport system permease protein